jgi:hypothetical protein
MPGIIGCTINRKYTACIDCEYKNSPIGCVGKRNRYDAIERLEEVRAG